MLVILLLKGLHLAAIGIWMGTMVFFSFFVGPAVFKTLNEEMAGKMITAVFDRYYPLNAACGVTAVITAVLLGFRGEGRHFAEIVRTVILMIMLTLALYSGFSLRGKIVDVKSQLRAKPPQEKAASLQHEFDRLHRKSVIINMCILAGGAVTFLLLSSKLR
jgi:uncharacterized membrane protein